MVKYKININHFIVLILPLFAFLGQTAAQSLDIQIEGTVYDNFTARPVKEASVFFEGTKFGTSTDEYGKFNIDLVPAGFYTLVVRHIAYRSVRKQIQIHADRMVEISLNLIPTILNSEEVIVTATGNIQSIDNAASSIEVISSSEIDRKNKGSMADIIDGATGIFLKNYGPPGSLQTLSLRGSKADQVLIFY